MSRNYNTSGNDDKSNKKGKTWDPDAEMKRRREEAAAKKKAQGKSSWNAETEMARRREQAAAKKKQKQIADEKKQAKKESWDTFANADTDRIHNTLVQKSQRATPTKVSGPSREDAENAAKAQGRQAATRKNVEAARKAQGTFKNTHKRNTTKESTIRQTTSDDILTFEEWERQNRLRKGR